MRYAILIALFTAWLFGALPSSWAVPLFFAASLLARTPSPGRRRGGYIHPSSSASATASPRTAERVGMYTGSSTRPGSLLAGADPLELLHELSKTGAHGSSGAPLAARLGAPTTDADEMIQAMRDIHGMIGEFLPGTGDCGCNEAA